MRRVYEQTGEILDPHSAIAVGSMQRLQGNDRDPMVALACAHPAKFPAAVRQALGFEAPLPPHLAHLMTAQERFTVLPAKAAVIRDYVSAELRLGAFA
jgi:threonine synthase